MKKLWLFVILFASCSKESSYQNKPKTLSNSMLVVNGLLNLQTQNANIASLGIINYRSSYELCGTSGSDLLWPVDLPLSDSSIYPASILAEGDSLSALIYLDTTYRKFFNITMIIRENDVIVNDLSVFNKSSLQRQFIFHNGSRYQLVATIQ